MPTCSDTADLHKRMRLLFKQSRQLSQDLGLDTLSNQKEAIQSILNRLGKLLKADRCVLVQIEGDEAMTVELEYTSGPEVFPYRGLVPPWGLCPFLRQTACKEFSFTSDTLKDLSVQAIPQLYAFFEEKGVRGGIGCPVLLEDNLRSVLVIHTVAPREWRFEELSLSMLAAEKIAAIHLMFREKVRQ